MELVSHAHDICGDHDIVVRQLGVIWCRTRFVAPVELHWRATEVYLPIDGGDPRRLLVRVLWTGGGGVAAGEELLGDQVR